MKSRRGSSAVFIMVILAALISITLALIYGTRAETLKSRVDGIVRLAVDSVMSEYNRDIQQEYGLFIVKGTDKELTAKLRRYVEHSLKNMGEVKLDSVKASGGRFSVVDVEPVREQLLEYMKLAYAEGVIDAAGEAHELNDMRERTLRHGPTIASLPSSSLPDKSLSSLAGSIADNIGNADQAFRKGTDKYMMNSYILDKFNSRVNKADGSHFFRNEVEYVLSGELSDAENEKRVETALKAMRFPLNLAHVYSDPAKRAKTLAMAQVLTPGAAAAATQVLLSSTWAYAEADNDVELLWKGYEVPLTKSASTWAIDLDSAVEGLTGGTAVPDVVKGYDYGDYLQILLFFKDENVKIGRIMDLIQINTRKTTDGDFLMNEHYFGIAAEVRVNGTEYGYEKKY